MAKANRKTGQKDINQRINSGCGQGRGADYKPAIWVRDFSSKGRSIQSFGWKTGRVHHFLSDLEFRYFLVLEWSPLITDIREQYPLPVEETLEIAQQCGIPHPINRSTGFPNIITTDIVVTIRQNIGVTDQARTVKPTAELQKSRVLEKFEIERRYWESRGISWGIVTECDIPSVLVENIKWLHDKFYVSDLLPLKEHEIRQISSVLTKGVIQGKASLRDIATECDERLGLEIGDSLCVARHLIANRQWLVDLSQPLTTLLREKLMLLATPTLKPQQQRGEVQ